MKNQIGSYQLKRFNNNVYMNNREINLLNNEYSDTYVEQSRIQNSDSEMPGFLQMYDLIDPPHARTAYTCEISLMLVSDNRVTRNSDGVQAVNPDRPHSLSRLIH